MALESLLDGYFDDEKTDIICITCILIVVYIHATDVYHDSLIVQSSK